MRAVRLLCRLAILLVCGLTAASPAAAEVRVLLVGISSYKHADDRGDFRNLKGAPNDVAAMAAVLQEKYGLTSERTTVLLDEQATRDGILGALRRLIGESREGDQLLFYFSGHGALVHEGFAGGGDETDRIDETIVPYDSRGADGIKDIRDDELRQLIRAAADRGVHFLSIFDSCNSGSATRGERRIATRSAPAATAMAPAPAAVPLRAPSSPARSRGFTVHLASARDGEAALEAEQNGKWRGDFTAALVTALHKLPKGASYRDLLNETRLLLAESGPAKQHPRGEGELGRSFLGTQPVQRRIFEVRRRDGGTWELAGGTIAGVYPGSQVALFATAGEAGAKEGRALGSATVGRAGPTSAVLEVAGLTPGPALLYARETKRKFPPGSLKVKLKGIDNRSQAGLRQSLAPVSALELVTQDPQVVFAAEGQSIRVEDVDGNRLASFPMADASAAGGALASWFSLLRLRDAGTPLEFEIGMQKVGCQGEYCENVTVLGNATAEADGEYRFRPGECFRPTLTSREARDRHVYMLHLGSDFSVSLIQPSESDGQVSDAAVKPNKPLVVPDVFCMNEEPGRDYFMLVATDNPVELSVLQQQGFRTRGQALDPLSQLLASSRHATRGEPVTVPVGDWGVLLASALTQP